MFVICSFFLILSCSPNRVEEESMDFKEIMLEPTFVDLGDSWKRIEFHSRLKSNQNLKKLDLNIALYKAEYLTIGESGEIGNTVFFKDVGNKQLGNDFVPFLSLDGTSDISFYVDDNRATQDVDVTASNLAIDRAMQTWDNLTCSESGLFEIPYEEQNHVGWVARFIQDEGLTDLDLGGSYDYYADIVHAGWLPGEIFDLLAENGGDFIIAAAFSIIFLDQNGNPIDLDNNAKLDTAFREIYYNDSFNYADGDHIDIETVALHEAGHGLSQGHFGKLFQIDKTGRFQFAPRAVMNAGYTGIQTEIQKTDNAGHCSNWSSWPEE